MKEQHEKEKTQGPGSQGARGQQELTVRSQDTSIGSTGIWVPDEERIQVVAGRTVWQELAFQIGG